MTHIYISSSSSSSSLVKHEEDEEEEEGKTKWRKNVVRMTFHSDISSTNITYWTLEEFCQMALHVFNLICHIYTILIVYIYIYMVRLAGISLRTW
jgi:hypothetical protein